MSVKFGGAVRLHSRAEFMAVQQHGRRLASRHFTLLALPNAVAFDRLGIVASRRIGSAVIRNTAKRRLREIFRHQEPDTAAAQHAPCLDFVVIAKRELPAVPFAALEGEFVTALGRLSARCRA
ncbi:MAG: ribonuclease P protein component [Vicinamibacterales bacterium]